MKYRFFEALDKIVGTERHIRIGDGFWFIYDNENRILKNVKDASDWWPSVEEQTEKDWEIEQEPIYVWCHSDSDNESWIYTNENPGRAEMAKFKTDLNLFDIKKFQKFRLVPVEEKEE